MSYPLSSAWKNVGYPDVPLIGGRKALIEFAPIVSELPDPSTDEFWDLSS